ncbi:restriction endonuclease subunit S [Lactobacillus delbrueckii]|uniref:restriction endonuclease subunit S n=1 Tax=Lactobacillus delbrueckii TaxID=1584 RepID=UPI0022B0357F|nr:restriction endonuclease subunit S [Lactobacillus delbrueckii]
MPGHAGTGGRDVIFAWEQCKLGDVAEIVGGGTPSTKKSEYWNGNINWFSPAEIGNQIFVSHSQKQITELGLMKSSAKILPAGTILFTSRAGIGNTAILTRNACTNQGFQSIVPYSNKLDSYFIYSESAKLKRYGETMGSGSTFTEVSGKQMKKMSLHIPNINEQAKIGNMLKILDQTITLHEEKKRQLERLKSALLQKMFADKSGYPVVRFKEFCDEWQGTKLRKISKIVRGASPRPISDPKWFDNDSNVGWLRISDVTSQDGRIHHLKQHISKQGQAKTRVISEPHLLLSIAATVGKPLINYVKIGVHDGFLIFIEPQFDLEFMFQWLEMFRPQWSKYGQPGSQINLNSDLVKNQIIYLPSREEQNQIGIFLNQIDSLINLHQQKINNINSVKKSLLQKMFI